MVCARSRRASGGLHFSYTVPSQRQRRTGLVSSVAVRTTRMYSCSHDYSSTHRTTHVYLATDCTSRQPETRRVTRLTTRGDSRDSARRRPQGQGVRGVCVT